MTFRLVFFFIVFSFVIKNKIFLVQKLDCHIYYIYLCNYGYRQTE